MALRVGIGRVGIGTVGHTEPAGGTVVDVPLATLTLSGFAPTVVNPKTIFPPVGTLTLNGFSPSVLAPRTVQVPSGTLTLTGFAPVVLTPRNVSVPLGTLTLSGFAPTVLTPRLVQVPFGTLTLTGFAPVVIVGGGGTVVDVPLATLTLSGFAPVVINPKTIFPPVGTLTLSAFAPSVATTGPISVPVGLLVLVGYEPVVIVGGVVQEQPTGGWIRGYERELARRRIAKLKQIRREEETEEIQDKIDREIAELIVAQEAKDEHRQELERLSALLKSNKDAESIRQYGERVMKAYERALLQGNFSALEAFDREISRAREEEEFLLLSILFLLN